MQLYDPKKVGVPSRGLFNAKEKRRVLLLCIGVGVMAISVVTLQMQSRKKQAARSAEFEPPAALPTEIAVPKIDVALLESVASDARSEQRVVLPGAALEAGFAQATQVYDSVYKDLGGRELTAEIAAQILAEPKAHRGHLLRVRCTVEDLKQLPNPADADLPRFFVRGHLEDGAPLYFAVAEFVGLAPAPGDFVRMDGLFLRVHSEEVDGTWREAPLFVGPRMYESSPQRAPVTQIDPARFAFVRDDSIENGLEGLDNDAYWDLVSYVKHLQPGQVDWEAAPILDNTTISDIFRDGGKWRCKPVRVPVARMMHVWTQAQPENPLRIETMIEGWFARGDWLGQAKVVRFVAPRDTIPPNVRADVAVRAFFYKNLAYTPKNGGVAIAPFFVVESLEEFIAPDPAGLRQLTYIVAGSLALLGVLIFLGLRRDRARSEALEAELMRRRRERRQKLAPAAKP